MVSMVVDNTKGMLHFRAVWKFPGLAVDRGEYYAPSLNDFARILFKSEGVSRESVEHVYVHQIQKDGSVLEIIAIDKTSNPNINSHLIWSSLTTNPASTGSAYDWEGEGFDIEDGNDERIMAEVYELLKAQGKQLQKPHIKIVTSLPSKPGMIEAGGYTAVPAVSKKEN